MLTLEQIKQKLEDANLKRVAEKAGVHYNSLYGLMRGRNPSYDTVKKLSDYLEGLDNAL
jgi:predicted transcriptional regulator